MDKPALIIFVRDPKLGKVKTRLAKTVGDLKALIIYNELLDHTLSITKDLQCNKYIFYADGINENDIWDNNIYRKKLQFGSDLGQRMSNAFLELFDIGHTKIIIIGSDCFELTKEIIENAFEQLSVSNIVIGPSRDGGYYLLGMQALFDSLFQNVAWSTDDVYKETIKRIMLNKNSVSELIMLNDVDEETDISEEMKIKTGLRIG